VSYGSAKTVVVSKRIPFRQAPAIALTLRAADFLRREFGATEQLLKA
jgi:hypothetical protein